MDINLNQKGNDEDRCSTINFWIIEFENYGHLFGNKFLEKEFDRFLK